MVDLSHRCFRLYNKGPGPGFLHAVVLSICPAVRFFIADRIST